MAKLVTKINGNFDQICTRIHDGILHGSISASLEDSWSMKDGNSRIAVMVFERYSYFGGNRVSMNVTLYQEGDGPVYLCAITAGGSQAMFFNVNTIGEESFLDTLREIL